MKLISWQQGLVLQATNSMSWYTGQSKSLCAPDDYNTDSYK
jgi:hypothetical protein